MKHPFPVRAMGPWIGMLILILDSRTALAGARDGMQLICKTVIPSLFPFFFLSIWLTSSVSGSGFHILRPIAALFRIPKGLEYLLLPGFLGGYPAGAQAVSQSRNQGILPKEDAQVLLGFCCNAGPSFLFGILAPMFPRLWMPWALWLLHIAGALTAAWAVPAASAVPGNSFANEQKDLPAVLLATLRVMGSVCGWILLFRIVLAFLDRWIFWCLPVHVRVFLAGLMELTNGCCSLDQIPDWRLRFVLAGGMLSFGGLCVLMQTCSVARGLDLKYYLMGKGIQGMVCILVSSALLYRSGWSLFCLTCLMLYLGLQRKKEVEIPGKLMYNGKNTSGEEAYHAVS